MANTSNSAAAPRLPLETPGHDAPPGKGEELPAYSPPSKHPLDAQVPLEQQVQADAGPSGSVSRQFPAEFSLYSSMLSRNLQLGEHKDAPIYLVATHTGWSGNPDVVLHTTTDSKSAPLATANYKTFSRDTTIVLPPLDSKPRAIQGETLMKGSTFGRTFTFSVEVPAQPGGQLRSEPFEWRHSRGEDVASLGSVWGRGWKLVRTATGRGAAVGAGTDVVAVFSTGPVSMTKKFCFKFVGAGETGVLGERWAVMAVISAIAIWEKERRNKRRSAAANSGAAAA